MVTLVECKFPFSNRSSQQWPWRLLLQSSPKSLINYLLNIRSAAIKRPEAAQQRLPSFFSTVYPTEALTVQRKNYPSKETKDPENNFSASADDNEKQSILIAPKHQLFAPPSPSSNHPLAQKQKYTVRTRTKESSGGDRTDNEIYLGLQRQYMVY